MPQPDEVSQRAEQLIRVFRRAEDDLTRQIAATMSDPRAATRRARLRQLRQSIEAAIEQLEVETRQWVQETLPLIYESGAQAGAAGIGDTFAWTQAHLDAVQVLAQSTYGEVLSATSFMRDSVKQWMRTQAAAATTATLLEGQTARQAARTLARLSAGGTVEELGGPLLQVLYADGSWRSISDYADMLVRTTSANAYNAGTLNHLTGAGIEYVEILDGADCGWTSHDDGDKPNGTVRPVKEAMLHSLSHPRCRRSFAGRPDITSAEQAKAAQTLRSPEAMADQAAFERATEAGTRARAANRRAASVRRARRDATPPRLRSSRSARSARQPRASRSAPRAATRPSGGRLPNLDDILAKTPGSSVLDEMSQVFDQTFADVSVRLESAQRATTGINIDGGLYDADGTYIGRIVRQIREGADGERSVYNAYLLIDARYQGQGFTTQYFEHLEAWYRANRISFIDVHADIDVGGYTWATKGFKWERLGDGSPNWGDVPSRLARAVAGLPPGSERDAGQAILDGLLDPTRWWTDTMIQPSDIALLGRGPGMGRDDMWLGKRALMGSDWHGRKSL